MQRVGQGEPMPCKPAAPSALCCDRARAHSAEIPGLAFVKFRHAVVDAQGADAVRSLGVQTACESQDESPAPAADAAAETDDADDAAGAGYLTMLRAALARCGQPAAAATVWAWLQVSFQHAIMRSYHCATPLPASLRESSTPAGITSMA